MRTRDAYSTPSPWYGLRKPTRRIGRAKPGLKPGPTLTYKFRHVLERTGRLRGLRAQTRL